MTSAPLPAPDLRLPTIRWRTRRTGRSLRTPLTRQLGLEILRVLGMLGLYESVRFFAGRDTHAAMRHAYDVVHVEVWMHLPSEANWQAPFLHLPGLVHAMNLYYAGVHLPVTGLALLWLFLRRREHYLWIRRSLFTATAAALGIYVLLPVAPPRMLPGITDTALLYGQSVYGRPGARSLADQYAAMPSLHVGWAVIMAVALIASSHSHSRWRWMWLLHPLITTLVVITTGNHYWLDAIAGALLALVTLTAFHGSASSQWPATSGLARGRPPDRHPVGSSAQQPGDDDRECLSNRALEFQPTRPQ